jgi:hypothetical protein
MSVVTGCAQVTLGRPFRWLAALRLVVVLIGLMPSMVTAQEFGDGSYFLPPQPTI